MYSIDISYYLYSGHVPRIIWTRIAIYEKKIKIGQKYWNQCHLQSAANEIHKERTENNKKRIDIMGIEN